MHYDYCVLDTPLGEVLSIINQSPDNTYAGDVGAQAAAIIEALRAQLTVMPENVMYLDHEDQWGRIELDEDGQFLNWTLLAERGNGLDLGEEAALAVLVQTLETEALDG